jgi:sugar lactone lactonase YvrE
METNHSIGKQMKINLYFRHLKYIALLCALLAVPIVAHAQNLYVSVNGVFANGAGSVSEYNAAGTQTTILSGLSLPRGLSFDPSGNLFVGDTFTPSSGHSLHAQLVKSPPSGGQSIFGNAAHAQFEGVVTNSAGNVFAVAIDQGVPFAGTIYKFAPNGTRTKIGSTPGQTFGLALDSAGNLYAADAWDAIIYKFAPNGTRTEFAGSSAFGNVSFPVGLAFDSAGNLFVSTEGNRGNDTILVFTPAGMETTFATGLTQPRGLAFDSAGNLFVAETLAAPDGDVLEFTTSGSKTVFASGIDRPEFLAFGPSR